MMVHSFSTKSLSSTVPVYIIIMTFLIGGLLGCLVPIEQDATVPSLVLAGKIPVQPDTILGQYFYGMWTLLNQAGEGLIRIGVSQKSLDYFYCFIIVGFRLSGYAMLIYGLSRWPIFSILASTMIFLTGLFDLSFVSPDYSAGWSDILSPHDSTYGACAYALSAFVVGAIAGKRNILAGFASSVLVAVHPVIGAYVVSLLTILFILSKIKTINIRMEGILTGLLWGAGITLLSFLIFWLRSPTSPISAVDPKLYQAYLENWDYHRSFPFDFKIVLMTGLAGLIFISYLKIAPKESDSARFATAILLLSVPISLFFYVIIDIFPTPLRYHLLPQLLLRTMPNRLLAIHGILVAPFLLGFAAFLYTRTVHRPRSQLLRIVNFFKKIPENLIPLVILCVFFSLDLTSTLKHAKDIRTILKERMQGISGLRTYNPFWASVRKVNIDFPVLVSPSMTQAAERAGHVPLLIDPGNIDFIPYKPETVNVIARIIETAYGVSFINPPLDMRHHGGFDGHIDTGHLLWEKMTIDQWKGLSKSLGIRGVLTPSDWKLHLPVQIMDKEFIFYKIP
jgi:hypothetical protein